MIRWKIRDGVLLLTLARPEKRNALDEVTARALLDAFRDAEGGEVRAVVLAADGPSFCAGADFAEMKALAADPVARAARSALTVALLDAPTRAPVPVVAAIGGPAMGAGASLALACDAVMMGEGGRLGWPEARPRPGEALHGRGSGARPARGARDGAPGHRRKPRRRRVEENDVGVRPVNDWIPQRLGDFLDRNAAERSRDEALVAADARLDHAEIRAQARGVARSLLALGIRRGDHVGILTGNDAEWVSTFYGAALVGAITVPINTRFKPSEIAFALRLADCRAVIVRGRFLKLDFVAMLREAEPALDTELPGEVLPLLRHAVIIEGDVPAGAMGWREFLGGAADEAELDAASADVRPDDPLLIQFTSGTTAYPKGVLLTHANMLRNAWAASLRLAVQEDDRYLNCRPFFHVAGSTLSLLVCLVTGATLVTPPTFDAGAALNLLQRERCTVISGNDSIFQLIMAHPDFPARRLHLRGGWAAAGPLTMRRVIEEMGVRDLCRAYGLSEASPNVVLNDHREPVEDRIAGRAKPHPGVEVRIADPATDEPLPTEGRGEIQVRGWGIMRGYHDNPDATARTFTPDGWLRTGDLGALDTAGRLRLQGRIKDVLRVGGENVAPAEVEEALLAHPAVVMAQVVGIPDSRLGEVPVAFVTLRAGHSANESDIKDWLRPHLANFRMPRHLHVVSDFEAIGMTARCAVPGSSGAFLTREGEDALWQQVFTAQPERRREFEPSSKRRKRRVASLPPDTA